MKKIIDSGEDWTEEKLQWIMDEVDLIAEEKYNIITDVDIYPNQIEIVSFEQMLDAYSRHGMPIGYDHWSIGEMFVKQSQAYKHRQMGLAFEIVLNSSPTINYFMEQNSMMMQTLVYSHAGKGHNYFFKNNYLFKEWTDAEGIIDYLDFAKKYVKQCEEKYGAKEVEKMLDAAHALQHYGIDKYRRPPKLSAAAEEKRREERDKYTQSQLNELWNSIPKKDTADGSRAGTLYKKEEKFPKEPQENILYFLEKHAPRLEPWQREILRIVRKISTYFYPQMQTQVFNEGFATWTHHSIMNDLYSKGFLTDGAMQEFLISHTNVTYQPDFDSKYYTGINPYALGFAIYKDIERISLNPTDEDKDWFKNQNWVGNGKYVENVKYAANNFKDDSGILQYLSPKVIRDLKLFTVHDDENDDYLEVTGIHNEYGYKEIRKNLSKMYDINRRIPNIQVTDVDIWGDRTMFLEHTVHDQKMLDETNATNTLNHLHYLWQYPVILQSVDKESNDILADYESGLETQEELDFNLSDL